MTTKKPRNANGRSKANPSPNASREGVYFLSITLENIRCFGEKQTLNLSDGNGKPAQWTILLGNNGAGKTTVLQAIALGAEIANEKVPSSQVILSEEFRANPDAYILPPERRYSEFEAGKHNFYRVGQGPGKADARVAPMAQGDPE